MMVEVSPMPCFGIVIKPERSVIQGSGCLTPAIAELLPAALEVCDVGLHESLEKGLGIWSSLADPQRPAAKQENLNMHKNPRASTPRK